MRSKQRYILCSTAVAILLFTSCSNDDTNLGGPENPLITKGTIEFRADKPSTRTDVQYPEEAGGVMVANWVEGEDLINIYMQPEGQSSSYGQYTASAVDSQTDKATFTGNLNWSSSVDNHTFFAYYAGAQWTAWSANKLMLPDLFRQVQVAETADHIGSKNVMVAAPFSANRPESDTPGEALSLYFSHLYPVLYFKIANSSSEDLIINNIVIENGFPGSDAPLSAGTSSVDVTSPTDYYVITVEADPSDQAILRFIPATEAEQGVTIAAGGTLNASMLILPGQHGLKVTAQVRKPNGKSYDYYEVVFNGTPSKSVDFVGGYYYDAELRITDANLGTATANKWDGSSAMEIPAVGDTYVVTTAAELAWVTKQVDNKNRFAGKTLLLANDLDLDSKLWDPIGKELNTFRGTVDGQNNSIHNLYINRTVTNSGLFGYIASGRVENLTVASGSVTSTGSAMGAIVGNISGGTIKNCFNYAAITGYYAAGICGFATSSSKIENCANYGAISSTSTETGYTAGIVGANMANSAVTACYNTGPIHAAAGYVGGISANVNGPIIACYNTGTITNIDTALPSSRSGGLHGSNYTGVILKASYNIGAVSGGYNKGAISGSNSSTASAYNYWGGAAAELPAQGGGTAILNATLFSATEWPTPDAASGWGLYTDDASTPPSNGYYWKSVGSWNGGDPVYPKLYWEE
ncbi:hypothetical protein [uncultured Alistipes sp.]|jgi:fibronectin type III domain protein|uniref:hypothetical protein n=1 Tax=uncultured Alistipes sp. TaxID=538949 RepID=UPI0025DB417C|nr:hypothetical protein [uncultured Alistipes sp.]